MSKVLLQGGNISLWCFKNW